MTLSSVDLSFISATQHLLPNTDEAKQMRRKGGAQKERNRKKKKLAESASKCRNFVDLFKGTDTGPRPGGPGEVSEQVHEPPEQSEDEAGPSTGVVEIGELAQSVDTDVPDREEPEKGYKSINYFKKPYGYAECVLFWNYHPNRKTDNKVVKRCFVQKDGSNTWWEYLTGFHKRKVERRKAAIEEIKQKLKEEHKRMKEERCKEYMKMLKERTEALEEASELDQLVTATTESVQYDHPNHTVTVTTVSDLDLTGPNWFTLGANEDLLTNGLSARPHKEEKEGENQLESEDWEIRTI
ncbi:NOL12 protein, partial [Polypterus senegalus]